METQCIADFPQSNMDKPPRKRPRLTWDWDVPPPLPPSLPSKAAPQKYFAQEFGGGMVANAHIYYKVVWFVMHHHLAEQMIKMDIMCLHLEKTYRLAIGSSAKWVKVLECWDMERKEAVAVKVIRSTNKYRDAAMIEIDVLQRLARHDLGSSCCVQMRNWFDYRNHICIVFEKLVPSLYDFLRKNSYRAFPIDLVRDLGRQLLESVAFMHDLPLIHTDLKPENILLVSSECIRVPDYKPSNSRRAEKYFKRGMRLDWPDGATSRESMKAIWKLPRLQNLVMQLVDHSAGDLIDLLQGLLSMIRMSD